MYFAILLFLLLTGTFSMFLGVRMARLKTKKMTFTGNYLFSLGVFLAATALVFIFIEYK